MARSSHDWELIETAYRAGGLSIRQIAAGYDITEAAIRQKAKKEGWNRDLEAKIKAKADDLVRKRELRKEVRSANKATERELVEATAEVAATIRMEHRADIRKARTILNGIFEQLGSGVTDAGEPIVFNDRVKSVKALSESLRSLIGLEREAYSIKEDDPTEAKDSMPTNLSDFYADIGKA